MVLLAALLDAPGSTSVQTSRAERTTDMTCSRLDRRLVLRAGALAALGLGLTACESLQDIPAMFERKPPPLPGDRQAVFPEGVPGVDRTIPQPANAPPDVAPPAPPAEQPPAEQQPRRRRASRPAAQDTN
ncbi:MAG: hypothetical protein J0H01_15635 [Rhizobiales bacterium]|nr:hypothetical protein [Hyphomicrobiales bacterium]